MKTAYEGMIAMLKWYVFRIVGAATKLREPKHVQTQGRGNKLTVRWKYSTRWKLVF